MGKPTGNEPISVPKAGLIQDEAPNTLTGEIAIMKMSAPRIMLALAMALALVMGSAGAVSAARPVPEGWTLYGGHYYKVQDNLSPILWTLADSNATYYSSPVHGNWKGHLVAITSLGENEFVKGLLAAAGASSAWIGATDAAVEGTWTWVTGETWSYEQWNEGEPNNSGGAENYAEILSSGFWNDLPNGYYAQYYVIELERKSK